MNTVFFKFLIVVFSISLSSLLCAQVSISAGSSAPNSSAMLDVQSTSKGFLPPRMNSAQRRAIQNPIAGLMVYDTDRQTLFFYNGSLWRAITVDALPANVTTSGIDAADGATGDALGVNIDISGNYAIVGAYHDDIGANANQGSAYIYKLENGNWNQMQKLTASDGQANDWYGSVAIDNDYAFVGAYYADINAGTDQGCVYVYKLENGIWVQKQKLVSANAAGGDLVGGYVDASKGYLVVGASKDDIGFNNDQGSAYIYKLDSTTGIWNEMQKLTANDGTAGDGFGYEVSIDSNRVLISAITDDVSGASQRGSAYIYTLQGGGWIQTTKLIATDGLSGDNFSRSVSIEGDYALIGSYQADATFSNQGACYLYKFENNTWTQKQKFYASDPATNSYFGTSVSLRNNYAVVGAQGLNTFQGAAYLFQLNTTNNIATQIQKITAIDGTANDYFGFASTINNYNILISAYGKNNERGRIYFKSVD